MKTFEEHSSNIITPTKVGQVVKFHTPYPDENPDQEWVVKEIDPPRALIQAINLRMSFPPTDRVNIKDLTVVRDER